MFDIGFSELLLIAVVALLVLGPERLPKAARLAGLWARKARTQWNAVKAELENEIADEELRRNLREASTALREGAHQLRGLPDTLRNDVLAGEATPAMAAIHPDQRTAAQSVPTQRAATTAALPDAARDLPVEADSATLPHDHDPAQLSLLAPDPAFEQMTTPLTSSLRRSDG